MQRIAFVQRVLFFPLLLSAMVGTAHADPQTHPEEDKDFLILPDGRNLGKMSSKGRRLALQRGTGKAFGPTQQAAYEKLKAATKVTPNHRVQWVLMDLDSHQVADRSLSSDMRIFGASSSKIFVGATLLARQNGGLKSDKQAQRLLDMLVPSDNNAWKALQTEIGDGNSDRGRERIHEFTQKMGYLRTRGYQGQWGSTQGNQLTADDTTEFLYDTYQQNYVGSETLWKVMHVSNTGVKRGKKYIPAGVFVGGKTGTYPGRTYDENMKPITVDVHNHAMVFKMNGRQYGLTILANAGNEEYTSLMAGGLFHEYSRDRR